MWEIKKLLKSITKGTWEFSTYPQCR